MNSILKSLVSTAYNNIYKEGTSMHTYCVNRVSGAVLLSNGYLFCINKPSINKDFCFGYRLSSYDTNEYDEANKMCETVTTDNGAFFKEKNLSDFNTAINTLRTARNICIMPCYENSTISNTFHDRDSYEFHQWFKNDALVNVTDEDVNLLINLYEDEKAKFEKRLNTYLKKYGTSKLNTWSYWSEE